MNAETKSPPPGLSPKIALASPAGATLTVVEGKKVTCLAIALPRGKHFKTYIGYDLSEIGRDQLLTALLDWRYAAEQLPDDEVRVMLAIGGDTDEPVFGVHADGGWWTDDAAAIANVYAWAHIPAIPPKRGGAS